MQGLPRVLAMFDSDQTSDSYGYGDRYHWAWGLVDFGNGTFQGTVHGLARLWKSGLWPYATGKEAFLQRIDSLFMGASRLTRRDGSLEEAFPREGSFCVTALVAFDLLVALDQLSDEIDRERKTSWLEVVSPLIEFVVRNDETHGLISNHLSTAVAALIRWDEMTEGDKSALSKADLLLERILQNQSSEGWFKEYEGADPGYQSLCTHYLADVHLMRKDLGLIEPLTSSIRFLWHFANPDGSFGGHYGSRSTRFYYPSGILALANEIPEARALSVFLSDSIASHRVVSLSSIDEPNLTPMFNSYCWAAVLAHETDIDQAEQIKDYVVPCESEESFRKDFPQAGMVLDRGADHYTIVNYRKGGVVQHYVGRELRLLDTGVVFENANKRLGSTQHFDENLEFQLNEDKVEIINQVVEMPKKLTTPFMFWVLRFFCLTVFRCSSIREFTKRFLVKYLITNPKKWPVWNQRTISFGYEMQVEDKHEEVTGFVKTDPKHPFVPIHMASKGYWQINDERSKNGP